MDDKKALHSTEGSESLLVLAVCCSVCEAFGAQPSWTHTMQLLLLVLTQWERVKRAGMAPSPRSSFAMVVHKGRAFLFGGASDNEAKVGAFACEIQKCNNLHTFREDSGSYTRTHP